MASPTPPAATSASATQPSTAAPRVAAVAGVVLATTVLHTVGRVTWLRRRGSKVDPLAHEVDLPGRFPPRTLVVLGDSAAAGHGLGDPEEAIARRVGRGLVDADGRATAVRSAAVDGATTADVLAEQLATARDAEVVLLGVGVNDALKPTISDTEVAEVTDRLLTAIGAAARDDATIVFLTCPDLSAAPGLPVSLRPVVGWRCRRVAAVQTEVADRHGITSVAVPRDRLDAEVFGSDGFHPGAEGHARLARRVVELLT